MATTTQLKDLIRETVEELYPTARVLTWSPQSLSHETYERLLLSPGNRVDAWAIVEREIGPGAEFLAMNARPPLQIFHQVTLQMRRWKTYAEGPDFQTQAISEINRVARRLLELKSVFADLHVSMIEPLTWNEITEIKGINQALTWTAVGEATFRFKLLE